MDAKSASQLYREAHDTHYEFKDLDAARELYRALIDLHPGTEEARYAETQLQNIASAQGAVAALGEAQATWRPDWTCPRCLERLEGQFTQCWHCGYSNDAAEAVAPTVEQGTPTISSDMLGDRRVPTCPECGSEAVHGELVSVAVPAVGLAVFVLFGDAAAAVAAGEAKQSVVKSFCLKCGSSWYPRAQHLLRVLSGPLSSAKRSAIVSSIVDAEFLGQPSWMVRAFESYYADAISGLHGPEHTASAKKELARIVEAGSGFRLTSEKRAAHVKWAKSLLDRTRS